MRHDGPVDMLGQVLVVAAWATVGVMLTLFARDHGNTGSRKVDRRRGWWDRNQLVVVGSLIMLPQLALVPFMIWLSITAAFIATALRLRQIRDLAG